MEAVDSQKVDSLSLLPWLTEDYIQSLLRQKYPASDYVVRKFTIKNTNNQRHHLHYFSVEVELCSQSNLEKRSFIVKIPSEISDNSEDGKRSLGLQAQFLRIVAPSLDSGFSKVSKDFVSQFTPTFFHEEDGKCIIVENPSNDGFDVGSWREGLDLEHSLAFMRFLAVFHAVSNSVLEDNPSLASTFSLPEQPDAQSYDYDSIKMSFYHIISELETWSDGSYFVKAVRKIGETLPERLAEASTRQPQRFKVLVHGDATARRILFRHGPDGQVLAVKFSDFEDIHIGSFAVDVNRFMNDSPNDNVLLHHSKTLLEVYQRTLEETLELLGKNDLVLSIDEINHELEAQKEFTQFAFFHVLPQARACCESVSPSDNEFAITYAFNSPEYRKLLRIFLQRFDAKGWFEEYQQENKDWPNIMDIWSQMYCQN